MRSRREELRVLLDTTFILPTLGINVGKEVEECIRKLGEMESELYYSRFSILESLWIAARLLKTGSFDLERFSRGLRSIIRGGRYAAVEEDCQVFEEAFKLYKLGHRDIIDNILYASSAALGLRLLTVDAELRKFIRSMKLEDTTIAPSQVRGP